MPRKRVGSVKESLDELRALEERYRGKPEQVRVTVLRLLKEDSERGIEDVALLVGYSTPTVKRWWRAYREGGMEALMGFAGGVRPAPTDEELNVLKQKLIAGDFSHIEDVRLWIESRVQLQQVRQNGSRSSAMRNYGQRAKPAYRNGTESTGAEINEDANGLVERLFKFLSSLPKTHTIKEWSDAFRIALQSFLGDVDRISISVNARCDLLNPQAYQPHIVISQSVHTGAKAVNQLMESASEIRNDNIHLERMLHNLKARKFPFGHYRPPVSYVYYHLDYAFLGVVVLWRERSKPPISEHSLRVMERLETFMSFLLSDFAARYQAATPVEHVFELTLDGLAVEIGLTMQERRIMILQLLGLSYEEMATTLSISLNTIRYHLRSIYSKTGTHSQAELFAKYFTPRIDPNQPTE
jgi:DNA-binding CsgD family transcriptional regulator/transposase